MGPEWLTQVENTLKQAGFRVEAGYPAHKAVDLAESVAAVNLKAMDEKEIREVLVTVLTPRKLGLEQCQSRAVQAVAVLATDGNQWNFSGWHYEEGIDCWAIEIHGIPAVAIETEEPEMPEGYTVLIGEEEQAFVTDFLAQQMQDRRLIYPHGQGIPSGVIPGKRGWTLKLTQLLPPGEPEPVDGEEPFSLEVRRGGVRQVYSGCCWQSFSSRQKPEGTEVVRSACTLSREVTTDGQDAV